VSANKIFGDLMQPFRSRCARVLRIRRYFFNKSQDGDTTKYQRKEILVSANKIFLDNPHWSIVKYDEALKLNDQCYHSLTKRAFGYYQIDSYPSAMDDANKALEIQPFCTEAHYVKALIYIKQDELTPALDSLHKSLDLTCPLDPRYDSIQIIIKNVQRKIKGENVPDVLSLQQAAPIPQPPPPAANQSSSAASNPVPPLDPSVDDHLPPFQDPNFVQTQQQISQQMYNMGDDKFKKRMEDLATIPELQDFQRKILSGQKPTQADYYKLYNEPSGRFAKFAQRLAQMQSHPDLTEFAQLAATGDWNVAFTSLSNNPKAMQAYMQFFKDDDEEESNTVNAAG